MEGVAHTVMNSITYTWDLGIGNVVHVYKEGRTNAVVSAEYDDKLRFRIDHSAASSITDWNQVVLCLAEAKGILRAIKKL